MYYTYVLQSEEDGKLYTGYTKDLKLRFEQHSQGNVDSTRDRRPLKLIYYEACLNKDDAIRRERSLKSYNGKRFLHRRLKSYLTGWTEGYGRFHYLDNAKFCSNSRGSCWETFDHLITAHDEELIPDDIYQQGRDLSHHAIKLLNGYMNYLYKQSKKKSTSLSEELAEYGSDNW